MQAKASWSSSRSLKVLHDVSESSSFCLFVMPGGKIWGFRLLALTVEPHRPDPVCLSGGTPDEALKLCGASQAGRGFDTFRPYPLDGFLSCLS